MATFAGKKEEQVVEEEEEEDEEDVDEEEMEMDDEELEMDDELVENEYEMFEDITSGPLIDTANTSWGDATLQACRDTLSQPHFTSVGLELYALRVVPASRRVEIRLDKLSDPFGSPSLSDMELFSRDLSLRLDAALGAEAAGQMEMEVSSPGAERFVRIPQDLERFRTLPMRVEYELEPGKMDVKVFQLETINVSANASQWSLADVKVNRGEKGRPMTKKQKALRFDLPLAALKRCNLYLDA